jgi:hypothetical protein
METLIDSRRCESIRVSPGRPEFLAFAAPFFVVQAMLLVPLTIGARERAAS